MFWRGKAAIWFLKRKTETFSWPKSKHAGMFWYSGTVFFIFSDAKWQSENEKFGRCRQVWALEGRDLIFKSENRDVQLTKTKTGRHVWISGNSFLYLAVQNGNLGRRHSKEANMFWRWNAAIWFLNRKTGTISYRKSKRAGMFWYWGTVLCIFRCKMAIWEGEIEKKPTCFGVGTPRFDF